MSQADRLLDTLLRERADELRDPDVAMAPERLGAARLTRYCFSRTTLRRAVDEQWRIELAHADLNDGGEGEVAYRIEACGHVFHFVAFLQSLPESAHTDRVIADRWEIAAALIEGELDDDRWAQLRANVPDQEHGRHDAAVLVLTRGNRSVRFFDYVVTELAAGRQPDADAVGDAGYIMRSTAFYGNGKYGMRSFEGYEPHHPLAAPYRAQFLAAWCFRELSYTVVEHCALARGGDTAVSFGDGWRTFFGLGNATGLGLVPYAFKHPRIMNAWVGVRELALANVRALPGTPARLATFRRWLDRAEAHYATGTDADAAPFLSPAELVPVVAEAKRAFEEVAGEGHPFDALMGWAMQQHPETAELVVSLLIELDESLDDIVDELLTVDEDAELDLAMTVGDARTLLDARFGWIDRLDPAAAESRTYWWVYSDNTEEPRRVERDRLDVASRDMAIDIVERMAEFRAELSTWPAGAHLGDVAAMTPRHLAAIERLFASDRPYGEPRDNPCSADYLPLQLQRFQLAQYGMDNFKPKSTDWLRVTLFQGAPRIADLADGFSDDWVLPPLPGTST